MLKKFNKAFDKLDELVQAGRNEEALQQLEKTRKIDTSTAFFLIEFAMTECNLHTKLGRSAEGIKVGQVLPLCTGGRRKRKREKEKQKKRKKESVRVEELAKRDMIKEKGMMFLSWSR